MSIAGLLLSLALGLIALIIVARPLFRATAGGKHSADELALKRDQLGQYYERVLTNIRDLDEDYATGKIDRADYQPEREAWVQRGIQLLRAQDELAAASAEPQSAERIDRAIETAVAAYRQREER